MGDVIIFLLSERDKTDRKDKEEEEMERRERMVEEEERRRESGDGEFRAAVLQSASRWRCRRICG